MRSKIIISQLITSLMIFFMVLPLIAETAVNTDLLNHQANMLKLKNGEKIDLKQAAQQAVWAGKLDEAAFLAKKSIKEEGDNPDLRLILGQSLLWSGKAKQAFEEYYVYFKLGGKRTPEVLYQYGDSLRNQKRFKEASAVLFEALDAKDETETRPERIEKLKARIQAAIGKCYLGKNQYPAAEKWFGFAKGTNLPMVKYYESMGDSKKQQAKDKRSLLFRQGNWLKNEDPQLLQQAKDFYVKAIRQDQTEHWLKTKLAEIEWKLGNQDTSINLLKKYAGRIDSWFPACQLAEYCIEEKPTNQENLRFTLKLLDRLYKQGKGRSLIAWNRARIHEKLQDTDAMKKNLIIAIKEATSEDWFLSGLVRKAIRSEIAIPELEKLIAKLQKDPENRLNSTITLMEWKKLQGIPNRDIIKFVLENVPLMADDAEKYELMEAARELDRPIFEEMMGTDITKYDELRKTIKAERDQENREKLVLIETLISQDSNSGNTVLLKEKARLLSSLDRGREAGDLIMTLADQIEENPIQRQELLTQAWKYYSWGGARAEAAVLSTELFQLGATDETLLTGILYSQWWDGDSALKENVLQRMKELYPASPTTLQFTGRKAMEKWKYGEAVAEFEKAEVASGEKTDDSISELIDSARKKLKNESYTDFFSLGDTSRLHNYVINQNFVIPFEGFQILPKFEIGKMSKPRMLNGTRTLLTRFTQPGIGVKFPIKGGDITASLNQARINPEINDSYNKLLWDITARKRIGDFSFQYLFSRQLMFDTPLALELGVTEFYHRFGYYWEKGKWMSSASSTIRRTADNNTRRTHAFSFGRQMFNSPFVWLKYATSWNHMDRDFDLANWDTGKILKTQMQAWEVYYSPKRIRSHAINLEYSRRFPNGWNLSSHLGIGSQQRPTVKQSSTRSYSLNLSKDTPLGEFIYNFYGSKSEVDPLSDQSSKSKYVGREHRFGFRNLF